MINMWLSGAMTSFFIYHMGEDNYKHAIIDLVLAILNLMCGLTELNNA